MNSVELMIFTGKFIGLITFATLIHELSHLLPSVLRKEKIDGFCGGITKWGPIAGIISLTPSPVSMVFPLFFVPIILFPLLFFSPLSYYIILIYNTGGSILDILSILGKMKGKTITLYGIGIFRKGGPNDKSTGGIPIYVGKRWVVKVGKL